MSFFLSNMGRERRELRAKRDCDEKQLGRARPFSSIPQLCVCQPALVHARRTVEKKQTTSSLDDVRVSSDQISHLGLESALIRGLLH